MIGNKKKTSTNSIMLWELVLPLLGLANLAYLVSGFIGSVITLGFFLLVPGFLLLNTLRHEIKSRWEIASFSLGLSLLIMMLGGLALNSLHTFGLARPLTTLNIFASLDIITLVLLALNRKKRLEIPKRSFKASMEQIGFVAALSSLPLLAAGGAIRLNNGASNVLTMVLFAAIPVLFMLLVWRKNMKSLYPYALFMMGLAVLFSTSLRGWGITGHDIHHEFVVFQQTSLNSYWSIAAHSGDPYNACLSITILPTILAKITAISAQYIFKAVYQVIFALVLVPVFLLLKKLSTERTALLGAFAFITFPAFLDDMPFINRQEIALVFFVLLLLTAFMKMARLPKTILSLLLITGVILSHYSSAYVMLGILIMAWVIHKLISLKRQVDKSQYIALLSVPVLLAAIALTYVWNDRITHSTANFTQTIAKTVNGVVHHSQTHDSFVQYSLIGPAPQSPQHLFNLYAGKYTYAAKYSPTLDLPTTSFGRKLSGVVNVKTINNLLHSVIAKAFQLLLLTGSVVLFFKWHKNRSLDRDYFYALVLAGITCLAVLTLLPEISVDYSVIRLFQQTMMILALPIVLGAEFIFAVLGRFKSYATAAMLAFFFLVLTGFVPQALGGFPAQLTLNNAGPYYDFFYTHASDEYASSWLASNRNTSTPIYMDTNSSAPLLDYKVNVGLINTKQDTGYLFQSYTNVANGKYRVFLNDGLTEYTDADIILQRNLLYTNQSDRIYGAK